MSTPGTPTPKEREARIAERRARRHARLRWLAVRGAIGIAALAVGVALLLYWLLTTVAGRELLLAQIVARLPAGTTLTWQSAEGPASGPLTLRGVRFRHGELTFAAEEVVLDPALRPLLGRHLRLDALVVRDARLDLPQTDEPFELPRWPESLPQIAPPLSLQADEIVVDDLVVTRQRMPVIAIHALRGGLHASTGRLHVERLRIDSDRGRFALHGDYVPEEHYRMDLTATAVFPAPTGRTPPRLGLIARGDAGTLDLAVGGAMPGPVRATLVLQPGRAPDAPRWSLRARGEGIDPAVLTAAVAPTEPSWTIALDAAGDGGRARLQGKAARGALQVALLPSRVHLEEQRLRVDPLRIATHDGEATLRGWADFRDPRQRRFRFAVNARGFTWRGATPDVPAVTADADLGLAGSIERWAAIGSARLTRAGAAARVDFDGRGDARQVRLRTLRAQTPGGTLEGVGTVAWAPRLSWTFDARLSGFDPGYFAPDWDGTLAGRIATQGQARESDGALTAAVQVPRLHGRLRGRALDASGEFTMRPGPRATTHYAGRIALTLGQSQVRARATMADTLDVDARFSPLRPGDLLPDGRGVLRGTLRLTGTRDAPDIEADLQGEGLAIGGYATERLQARGRLPWRGADGRLTVRASGIEAGVPLATLAIDARGAVEDLRLEADARGELGELTLAGDLERRNARWRGTLATLALTPQRGASWRLRSPARFAWQGRAITLSQACLASSAGGALCADADWPRRGVAIEGDGLPLALAQPWLPERDGRPWQLRGELAIDARLRPVGNGWSGEARVTSASGGLRLGDRAVRELASYRDLVLGAELTPQRVRATLGAVLGDGGRIDAELATGWDPYAPLSGELAMRTRELTWIELFSPDIVEPTGLLEGRIALGGTRARPQLGGSAALSAFRTEVPSLGIVLRDGDLRLDARPDGSARIAGNVRSGDGVLRVDGTLGGQGGASAPLVLDLTGEDVLVSDTRELRAVVDPDIEVRYAAEQPLTVTGTVFVDSAALDLEGLDGGVPTSPDVVVLDPVDPEDDGLATPLVLDLTLRLGDDVRLDGFGLEGTVAGDLRVRTQPGQEMRASGRLDVDGRYTAYGQELEITRGQLAWSNGPVADPLLDIRAEREVGEVTAGIDVTGRASAPQAEVWSDPASSQSEALAYLALGRPLGTLTGDEGRQIDAASAALTAGGSLLASQIGARIGLDDAGVMQSRALGGSVFGIGKFLSPRLYVSYGVSLLGTGQVLTLKYLLRKGFEVEIESSTLENRASVNWRHERGGPRSRDVEVR